MDVSIDDLTAEQRLELIEKLWDSLSDEQVPVLAEARAEIERRLETYCEDHKAAVPWEEARARLLQPEP